MLLIGSFTLVISPSSTQEKRAAWETPAHIVDPPYHTSRRGGIFDEERGYGAVEVDQDGAFVDERLLLCNTEDPHIRHLFIRKVRFVSSQVWYASYGKYFFPTVASFCRSS